MRPVVSTVSVATVSIAIPGISSSVGVGSSSGLWLSISRPLYIAIVAIRAVVSTVSVAIVAVPGISISSGVSHSGRVSGSSGLWLSLSRPLSIIAIVAIRPVVSTVSIATVTIAIVGISSS